MRLSSSAGEHTHLILARQDRDDTQRSNECCALPLSTFHATLLRKGNERMTTTRLDALFAVLAALLVLLSALWDPRISVALACIALLALGAYEFWRTRHTLRENKR